MKRMNKKKWIILGVVLFLLLMLGLYCYYSYVMQDQWNEEEAAILAAKQYTSLTQVIDTSKSVWDEIYWVVHGKDAEQQEMLVWVTFGLDGLPKEGESAVHSEYLANGTSKQQVKQLISRQLPNIEEVRLLPSVYNGEYVWQLFYKQDQHYYYRFFRFSDGEQIGSGYTLPNR